MAWDSINLSILDFKTHKETKDFTIKNTYKSIHIGF